MRHFNSRGTSLCTPRCKASPVAKVEVEFKLFLPEEQVQLHPVMSL